MPPTTRPRALIAIGAALALTGCGLLPGSSTESSSGSSEEPVAATPFEEALSDAWLEPGEQGTFAFQDTEQVRRHLGSTVPSSWQGTEAELFLVGLPRVLTSPIGEDLGPALLDHGKRSRWTQTSAQRSHTVSTMRIDSMPSGLGEALTSAGWHQEERTSFLADEDGGVKNGATRVVEYDDDRLVAIHPGNQDDDLEETRRFRADREEFPIRDDDRFDQLRGCLGDRPVAVSLIAMDEASLLAHAIVTDRADGELTTRACALAESDVDMARSVVEQGSPWVTNG